MWPKQQETADLVTFTEEIFNGKFHVVCSVLDCSKHGGIKEKGSMFWNIQIIWMINGTDLI